MTPRITTQDKAIWKLETHHKKKDASEDDSTNADDFPVGDSTSGTLSKISWFNFEEEEKISDVLVETHDEEYDNDDEEACPMDAREFVILISDDCHLQKCWNRWNQVQRQISIG